MKFLEKDLEEIIFNADRDLLISKGLYIPKLLKRQLRIGNYGIADLIGFDRVVDVDDWDDTPIPIFTVFELKLEKISVSSFLQAVGYLKGLRHYLVKKYPNIYQAAIFEIVLVGRTVDCESTFIYLPYLIDNNKFRVRLYTYEYDIDGIKFISHQRYALTNPGF